MKQLAVYAVDPGGISGVARGIMDMTQDDVASVLAASQWEAWEVHGTAAEQAHEIVGEYYDWWRKLAADGFYLPAIDLVVEDFQLRPKAMSDKRLLWPVRIAGAIDFWCLSKGHKVVYQQPSQAMSYATADRLRKWGLWVPGRDHRRDALRHAIFRVHKLLT